MADDAEALHRQRELRVIDRLGWIPAQRRVAGFASVARLRVCRSFALGNRAVVTADAVAHHVAVIEVHVGTERDGVMAVRAVVRALNVRLRLRSRIEGRPRDVAYPAIARGTLEHRIQVAGLAWQVPVDAV